MITITDISNKLPYYRGLVKNKYLKNYINLVMQYEYPNDIDFTEFIDILKNNDSKSICKDILNKFREKGNKKKEVIKDFYEENDYYNDRYSDSHLEALSKNEELIGQLYDIRRTALNIGTNKLKRRLNKLAETDNVAKALRLAIEAEDKSTQAKDSYGKYRSRIYDQKRLIINQLVSLFHENETWVFGKHKSEIRDTNDIIFFEIPNCEQISFHTDLNNGQMIPKYLKEWDGKVNSTFNKLLDCVIKTYPNINK